MSVHKGKTYNLAVEFAQYVAPEGLKKPPNLLSATNYDSSNPNLNHLPKILDVHEDEEDSNRRNSPFKNIFSIVNQENTRTLDLGENKQYNIVGKKQFKAYQNKLMKKKNNNQKRNGSVLSLSRYSSSVKSQHDNTFLNKQDVISMIRPNNLTEEKTQNLSSTVNETGVSYSSHSKPSRSMRKQLDKHMSYAKTWEKEKLKKQKFPSILDHISRYRTKVETLEANTLNEQKSHTKESLWIDTLRTAKNTQTFYGDRFIEKIISRQNPDQKEKELCLKGKAKLAKEMQWIEEKDRLGHTFAFVDSSSKNSANPKSVNYVIKKEESLSKLGNGTAGKEKAPEEQRDSQTANEKSMSSSFSNYNSIPMGGVNSGKERGSAIISERGKQLLKVNSKMVAIR